MKEETLTETDAAPRRGKSLLKWLLEVAVGFNLVLYLSEITIKLIFDLLSALPPGSVGNFLLGTSRDWQFFLRVRLVLLLIGMVGALLGWAYEGHRRRQY